MPGDILADARRWAATAYGYRVCVYGSCPSCGAMTLGYCWRCK